MSAKKCIYRAVDNDEDSDSLITACFEINPEVQFKPVPTTGEEYLLHVIKERKKCKTVVKCELDYSVFAKNQSCFIKECPRATAPDKLKPTIEWQNIQVADFSDVRMYISRLLIKYASRSNNVKSVQSNDNSLAAWKDFFTTQEPTLTCVLSLHITMLDRGLQALTDILGKIKAGDSIDHKTGQWIYAFLACTRQPLLSDTISIIRDLARRCADIRSRINPDDEDASQAVAPLNIFICLVARYFRQYDLAD